jgi:hypothetical protein
MMPKLNQIIAVVQGKKSRTQKLLTEIHRGWNQEAITGISKTYTPKDEEGEQYPSESKRIHLDVPKRIREVAGHLTDFFDVVATQETSNTEATADVVVDGSLLLNGVPVGVLLFLEKQLVDLHTFVSKLPVLPPDRVWNWHANRGCFATEPVETLKTQKVPDVLVKFPATKEHPAQTEAFMKDVVVGKWHTTYMSSAIPAQERDAAIARIEKLQDAVKTAREEANSIEAVTAKIGERVLEHCIGSLADRVQSKS